MNPDKANKKRKLEEPEMKKAKKAKANKAKLDQLKSKMGVDQGYGHYADANVVGPGGMGKTEAKEVLKLLNLGCKEVNFRLDMSGERETVRVTYGDFSLWMKVYPDDSQYYRDMDSMNFMLKKKGDPDFKFKAEIQIVGANDKELRATFPDQDDFDREHFSGDWDNGFQHISDEFHLRDYGWRRGWSDYYYLLRINVTVL